VISQRTQRHRRSGDLFADSLRKCVIGLSERYGQIEIFRLRALRDLVAAGHFAAAARHAAARAELARKALIYAAGCRKRGRHDEAREHDALALRWSDGADTTRGALPAAGE
jgi:hypothetical protein